MKKKNSPTALLEEKLAETAELAERLAERKPKRAEKQAPKPIVGIPPSLLCPVCDKIIRDAVIVACCGNSGCDDCKYIKPIHPGNATIVLENDISFLSVIGTACNKLDHEIKLLFLFQVFVVP